MKGNEIRIRGTSAKNIKMGRTGDYELFKNWLSENAVKGRYIAHAEDNKKLSN